MGKGGVGGTGLPSNIYTGGCGEAGDAVDAGGQRTLQGQQRQKVPARTLSGNPEFPSLMVTFFGNNVHYIQSGRQFLSVQIQTAGENRGLFLGKTPFNNCYS